MKQIVKNILQRIITGWLLSILFYFFYFKLPALCLAVILAFILCLILIVEWPRLFPLRTVQFWLLMPLYPILPFVCIIAMNQHPHYHALLFFLFIIVAAHDTGSYIVGSLFGKKKIAPAISPGKTWEGFWGGYSAACCSVAFFTYGKLMNPLLFIIVLITCFLSLLGDLFESWLKRRAHIKDSGHLLPGHGGLLDRFDGILFAAYFFFIFKDHLIAIFGV